MDDVRSIFYCVANMFKLKVSSLKGFIWLHEGNNRVMTTIELMQKIALIIDLGNTYQLTIAPAELLNEVS